MIYLVYLGVFLAAFLGFFLVAKRLGKVEEQASEAQKEAANVRKADEVLVEHRTPDDAADRLQNGSF